MRYECKRKVHKTKVGGNLASEQILQLSELNSSHVAVAGGKGASLGELTRAGGSGSTAVRGVEDCN